MYGNPPLLTLIFFFFFCVCVHALPAAAATIIRNVDGLVQDKDRSIIMIVLASIVAAIGSYQTKHYVEDALSDSKYDKSNWRNVLRDLTLFLLDAITNVLVQLTSSLSATLATAVFSAADTLLWGLVGAIVSLLLLWLLQRTLLQTARDSLKRS